MSRKPVLTPLDIRPTHCDNRGDDSHHYGFVYFADEHPNYDGQDVRVGYMGGAYDSDHEADSSLHAVQRHCPYVFNANWGEPTFTHIIAAWDFLVRNELEGFRDFADAHPSTVRWMNGSDFVLCDRATLELAAVKERQTAMRKRGRSARIAAEAYRGVRASS